MNYRCVVRIGLGRGRKFAILLLKAEGSNKYNTPGSGGTGGSGKVKSSIDDDVAQGGELRRPTT